MSRYDRRKKHSAWSLDRCQAMSHSGNVKPTFKAGLYPLARHLSTCPTGNRQRVDVGERYPREPCHGADGSCSSSDVDLPPVSGFFLLERARSLRGQDLRAVIAARGLAGSRANESLSVLFVQGCVGRWRIRASCLGNRRSRLNGTADCPAVRRIANIVSSVAWGDARLSEPLWRRAH